VEYEFRLSARNAVDYGDVTTSTIRTPDGSESRDHDHNMAANELLAGRPNNTSTILSAAALFPLFQRALCPSA